MTASAQTSENLRAFQMVSEPWSVHIVPGLDYDIMAKSDLEAEAI
jgi:hypothetical protein